MERLMVALASFTAVTPLVVAAPSVSLLIDNKTYASSGTLKIRDILPSISARKGYEFHFGTTYTASDTSDWTKAAFTTTWNHVVAEADCKWKATEPTRGNVTLEKCQGVSAWAGSRNASFRGHNTFWHNNLPSWLPANFTSTELMQTIIPNHVKNVISGMGTNVTSWDVANELIGDTVSRTMTAFQCIEAKKVWPTTKTDDDPTPFLKDLAFVRAAFTAAHAVAVPGSRLVYNDYSTGQNNSKTECIFKLLADLNANASIPYSRLGVGFQTHISATPGGFASKADLMGTFARLKILGSGAFITEIDIKLAANTTSDLRYQAAIWGDYLDVCLYNSNCHEFLSWNNRDDRSWIKPSDTTVGMATMFDSKGLPKLIAYELQARLQRYASGASELCATALGNATCKVA